MTRSEYSPGFFACQDFGSLRSARTIVPALVDVLAPDSVVDVGGGTGTWASVFVERGVEDVVVVDGDYVDRGELKIPKRSFVVADLNEPLTMNRTFDIALCLEVGEHLPASSAGNLVESLTKLAPAVVFSAAVPGQGGTTHVNEQRQSYWANLFNSRGFQCFDLVRSRFWDDQSVEPHYRANILIYVRPSSVRQGVAAAFCRPVPLDVVHPDLLDLRIRDLKQVREDLTGVSAATLVRKFPGIAWRAVSRRLKRQEK